MKKSTYKYLLTIYLILMIFISYINQGINNIGGLSYFEAIYHSTNLVPLNNISIKQCIISFVQFMPLGYPPPRVFPKLNSKRLQVVEGFRASKGINKPELLTLTGYFDISSILLGFMGSYLIYRILK